MSASADHAASTSAGGVAAASRWRLLRTTPLRDVLRLRLSGRLDIERRLAAADLPAEIEHIIRRTVRRSRLRRLERADLADELITHFQDGLEAGAAPAELIERFGDPRRAARLMRRARKRTRTLHEQIAMRTIQALIVIVVVAILAYGVLAVRYFTGSPRITTDYLETYKDEATAAPVDERAWPDFRAAYLALEPLPKYLSGQTPRPVDANWQEATQYLQQRATVLERVRRASRKPALGFPIDYKIHPADLVLYDEVAEANLSGDYQSKMMLEVLLPHFGPLRVLGKVLAGDLRLAATQVDNERVVENAKAILNIGSHAHDSPFLISDLVGFAIWNVAATNTKTVLTEQPDLFTDAQLIELADAFASLAGGGDPRLDLQSERDSFYDVLQRIYTDDGNGEGHITAEGLQLLIGGFGVDAEFEIGGPVLATLIADRQEMKRTYDKLMEIAEREARLPYHERPNPSKLDVEVEKLLASSATELRYLPVTTLMPALSRVALNVDMAVQQRDAVLVGIALERHRRRFGAYPAELTALVPRYLPAVPIDRISGEPVRYKLVEGRPLVYGVGMDGDDDGGVLPEWLVGEGRGIWLPQHNTLRPDDANDGDWILFPQPPLDPVVEEDEQ
jgi:hypothetical protein